MWTSLLYVLSFSSMLLHTTSLLAQLVKEAEEGRGINKQRRRQRHVDTAQDRFREKKAPRHSRL